MAIRGSTSVSVLLVLVTGPPGGLSGPAHAENTMRPVAASEIRATRVADVRRAMMHLLRGHFPSLKIPRQLSDESAFFARAHVLKAAHSSEQWAGFLVTPSPARPLALAIVVVESNWAPTSYNKA